MLTRTESDVTTTIASWPRLCSAMTNRKPTVLLAEDDASVSAMICLILKNQDFEVRAAESGLEALRLAHSWKPDIIILDINLPEMSGLEICRTLKADVQ